MFDSFTFVSRDSTGADPASTDNFTDIPLTAVEHGALVTVLLVPTSGPVSANWKNTGSNSIDVRVLGSNDRDLADADWDIVVASAAITAGASRHVLVNPGSYQFYKFQHKATVGGSQGKSAIRGCEKRI
jgi:hypothetical protein